MSKKLIIIAMLAIIGFGTKAQTAYITNYSSNTVSVINVATNTVTATIPVGTEPWGVSVSPDGSKVYVTDGSDSLSVINSATNTVAATIIVGSYPVGVSVSPNGSKVYVAVEGEGDSTVSVINTATNTVTNKITVGYGPYGVAVNPDGSTVYVTNDNNNSVSVISTAANTVTATITVDNAPQGIVISPDGSTVYVANFHSNTVSVINTATNTVTATIPVGAYPIGVSVSPDGSKVYVSNSSDVPGTISVINRATNTVSATITVGNGPTGVSISPDGSKVFVANNDDKTVSVINTATNAVSATITVGTEPIAFGNFITPSKYPSINTSGNATICKGSDTTICVYGSGGTPPYKYLWSNSDTSSCQTVSPVNTTSYSATVTDANSYSATSSLTITVDTFAKPVITPSGSILYSTAGASYQWNLNGNPIPGATGQFYAPLSPGAYSVMVTYANGCFATSDVLDYTGINELSNSLYISIYPNPASEEIQLIIEQPTVNSVEVYNLLGEKIYSTLITDNRSAISINIATFANGVYFLKVENEKGVAVKKFVKE